jgi:CheY-like chemotaxis protein
VLAQIKSLGYRTLSASNGPEALNVLRGLESIDLLFTDVIMPGSINGRQLSIEALKLRPALKVLFTSGYTENAIDHDGRLDQGVQLLRKPYRRSDLANMIRTALTSGATDLLGEPA